MLLLLLLAFCNRAKLAAGARLQLFSMHLKHFFTSKFRFVGRRLGEGKKTCEKIAPHSQIRRKTYPDRSHGGWAAAATTTLAAICPSHRSPGSS